MNREREIMAATMAIARRQHGIVTRAQLLEAGLSSHQVDHRVATGLLVRLHQGVYRAGPTELPHAPEMAAVLACGPRAVVSHGSAARMLGLEFRDRTSQAVHVAVRSGHRQRPGLRIHRLATLEPADVTRIHRIPVTTPARTIWDLAGSTPGRELERALASGIDRGLVRPVQIRELLDRYRGAPGSLRLRSLLERGPALTRSEAEARFLGLVRQAQLPEPRANALIEGLEVDFYWPAARLVVEVDGFEFHGSATAFEADRQRDARLVAAGLRVIRVTWRQLTKEAFAVVAQVSVALTSPGPGRRHPSG